MSGREKKNLFVTARFSCTTRGLRFGFVQCDCKYTMIQERKVERNKEEVRLLLWGSK